MTDPHGRVVHLITSSTWGGAGRVVRTLAADGPGDAVVACGPGGRLVDELAADGIPVRVLERLRRAPAPLDDLRTLRRIRGLLASVEPALLHCHSTKAGALGRLAARLAGVPAVFTVHGWGFYNTEFDRFRHVVRLGERALAPLTDAVVCVSEHDRRRGRAAGVLGPDEGVVVHNGVPAPTTGREAARRRLEEAFDIPPDAVVVGAVARLAHQKAPLEILRTIEAVADRTDRAVRGLLVGDGPLRADCERYVSERGLDGVTVAGFRADALELLPGLDVFLLPSRFEGFPLAVLEAMHAGVPVVAHDVGGVPEALGDAGVVVDPDGGAFRRRAADLVADPATRERLAARARERAAARFTPDRMVTGYEAVYADVLNGR